MPTPGIHHLSKTWKVCQIKTLKPLGIRVFIRFYRGIGWTPAFLLLLIISLYKDHKPGKSNHSRSS
jgi:hypothetical protein